MRRNALRELTLARIREFLRQPEALFWVFAFPVLLALGLGFAFQERGPEQIPIGVTGPQAAELEKTLASSPALLVRVYDETAGREALRTGRISLLVEGEGGAPVFRFDPTRPESRIARLEASAALQTAAGRRDPVPISTVETREPGARYIDFLIPGLLGLNLMGTGMWSVGFSVATARMQKLLKRLVATPMRRSDYLLSHMLSRLIFLVLEVVVLIGFGWWAFDVAVRGSLAALALVSLLGAFTFTALGMLAASRAETLEGVSGLMNLIMVPMWVMSGVFFSVERFPDAFQPVVQALPLTALNDALRAIINEAQPLTAVAGELAILVAWGIGTFLVALKIFKWR
ncbi:MAG: ABC transporter permease [Thermoanaerobaculia bacterium]